MKILEKLKTIGLHIPNLKISILNFTFTTDKSLHVDGPTLHINPEKLTPQQRRQLKHILQIEGLDEAGAIVDARSAQTVGVVIDALPQIEEKANKFEAIIPPGDMPLLKACLFLRQRYEAGESVDVLKGQIVRTFGPRGGNLSNLCSTGYLENWFFPLYESLLAEHPNDPNLAKLRFQVTYNTILTELPFTEFVATNVTKAKALKHIVEKMKVNVSNGVRYMEIHALGPHNVEKVAGMLPEILEQTKAIITREDRNRSRIFVRLEQPRTLQQ